MDYPNHTTEHQAGKHLTYEDYITIEIRLKDGWTAHKIAVKELHCAPNTVRNIIKKGMTPLYHGKVLRFKAHTAWKAYQKNRSHCCQSCAALEKCRFLQYVEAQPKYEDSQVQTEQAYPGSQHRGTSQGSRSQSGIRALGN